MSIIIKNDQIILKTRHSNNRRSPNIKMYKIKNVTPHVSNPHDHVNHMFKRP
jgi:hypothetical protein